MNKYGVGLFHTNSAVMHAEAVLLRAKLSIKLIPTPRDLSSDCGVALRFDWTQVEEVRRLLSGAGVQIAGIYPL